jgi:hypothetical protein
MEAQAVHAYITNTPSTALPRRHVRALGLPATALRLLLHPMRAAHL